MSAIAAWQWTGAAFEPSTSIPLTDRGFRYGMAVFESLRVADHEAQFLAEHLERLRTACELREFPLDERALAHVAELVQDAGIDGFARIYVTGGDGLLGCVPTECRVYVFIEERKRPTVSAYVLDVCKDAHHPLFDGRFRVEESTASRGPSGALNSLV